MKKRKKKIPEPWQLHAPLEVLHDLIANSQATESEIRPLINGKPSKIFCKQPTTLPNLLHQSWNMASQRAHDMLVHLTTQHFHSTNVAADLNSRTTFRVLRQKRERAFPGAQIAPLQSMRTLIRKQIVILGRGNTNNELSNTHLVCQMNFQSTTLNARLALLALLNGK